MYVLEELLLADSLEKIIRMEVYLNDTELQASEDEIKIVTFYKNIIKTIKNQLENSAESLKAYHGNKIHTEISTTIIKNCLNVSLNIRDIHNEFLSYLPSLKTRAETYTFLNNLLEQITEIETESIKPAIVLFDTYNYEERNISQSLKEIGIIKEKIEEQIIIGLPKAEKDNPLMWTILVHEIGHALAEKNLNIFSKINTEGILDKKIDYSHQTILKNWIKEIISDLLSIRIIGPSYLHSFMSFSLLLCDLKDYNYTHPSPEYRISLMMSTLEKKGFELESIRDIYNILHQMQSKNLISEDDFCPECKKKINPLPDLEKIKEEFYQLVDLSIKIIDEIKIKEYTPEDLKNSKKLVNNLIDFIPISSIRIMDNKQLNEALELFNKKPNDIYELLERFEEKPNSVSNIINAGWIHKRDHSYSEFIKFFFENNEEGNNTFNEKYDNYKNYLIQTDELLLKSLEISDMHLLLESGRSILLS